VPRLQARQPEYSGLILGGGGELSLQHRVQTGPGAHPASFGYLGSLFAAAKRPVRDANHSLPSTLISTKGRVLLFSTVSRLVLTFLRLRNKCWNVNVKSYSRFCQRPAIFAWVSTHTTNWILYTLYPKSVSKVKVKGRKAGFIQHCSSLYSRLCSRPWCSSFLHLQRSHHTKRRGSPLLAKEGTFEGI
jgi:hypothetical protein